jgi:hypothetical protein
MRHATKDLHFWVRCATKIFLLASGLGERFVMERFDGCIRNWGTKIVGMFCFTSVLCGGLFREGRKVCHSLTGAGCGLID